VAARADGVSRPSAPRLTVYEDGACPVCSRAIAHDRQQPGAQACQWVDATHCPPDALGADLLRAQALGRFHVRLDDGRLVDGAAGFGALRPLAALADGAFLGLRPLWRGQPPRPV